MTEPGTTARREENARINAHSVLEMLEWLPPTATPMFGEFADGVLQCPICFGLRPESVPLSVSGIPRGFTTGHSSTCALARALRELNP